MNVVVGECNDGYLNDIRACSIQESNVYEAIADAGKDFALGAVGAGRGMSCFEMKGGIGSASRVLELNGEEYTVGLLVLSNFGLKNDYIKENVSFHDSVKEQVEQGSIIIILATDIPMSDRQLKRVCKRMPRKYHIGTLQGRYIECLGWRGTNETTTVRSKLQYRNPFFLIRDIHMNIIADYCNIIFLAKL